MLKFGFPGRVGESTWRAAHVELQSKSPVCAYIELICAKQHARDSRQLCNLAAYS